MSKKKRVGEFLDLLNELSEEEIFSLGRVLGVKFGKLEILDQDENPIGKTLGELRDEIGEEELRKRNYKVRAVKRDAEEILAEIMETFYKASWGAQKDILEIMKAKPKKKDVVEDDNCALTINSTIPEVELNGTSTEN